MVALCREMDQTEAELLAACEERPLDDAETALASHVPDMLLHAQCDVDRNVSREFEARAVNHVRPGA